MFIDKEVREVLADVVEASDGGIYLCHVVPGFEPAWFAIQDILGCGDTLDDLYPENARSGAKALRVRLLRQPQAMLRGGPRRLASLLLEYGEGAFKEKYIHELRRIAD